jgi:hypothetical protein
VNCEYWTKAIALPRVPEHFHSRSQATIAPMAIPVRPGSLSDRVVALLRRIAILKSGQGMHLNVKNAVASLAVKSSPPGQPWGLGAMPLGSQSPHVQYCPKTLSASFGATPFPCV